MAPQSSRRIKPVHFGEEYDVDVGLYFEWDDAQDAEPTPKQLRDWVQAELLEYEKACEELKKVEVPPKERCSRASYIRQFHIDTPVYHLNTDSDIRRLACLSGRWEYSDPKKQSAAMIVTSFGGLFGTSRPGQRFRLTTLLSHDRLHLPYSRRH